MLATHVTGGCSTLAAPLGCRPSRPSRNKSGEAGRNPKAMMDAGLQEIRL